MPEFPPDPVFADPTAAPTPRTPSDDGTWMRPDPTAAPWEAPVAGPTPEPVVAEPVMSYPPRPYEYVQDDPPAPAQPTQRRSRWGKAAGGGGAVVAAVAKFWVVVKGVFLLLKLHTLLSALLSVWLYAHFWGWPFAVGFVALMFLHEMGHVIELRRQGIKATAPMFIPFLGAFVSMKSAPRSIAAEAVSALAGPFAGVIASGAVLFAGTVTGSAFLTALAYTGFLLNLFNLVPMLPLDGGRVAGALHPAAWFAGLVIVAGLLVWRPSPVIVLILVLGGFELRRRWKAHRSGASSAYESVPPRTRMRIGLAYGAVLLCCVAGMIVSYAPVR